MNSIVSDPIFLMKPSYGIGLPLLGIKSNLIQLPNPLSVLKQTNQQST